MYDQSDPRSALTHSAAPVPTAFAAAEYVRFYAEKPADGTELLKLWYGRGQNFVVVYGEAEVGAVYSRQSQPDEYALIIPDDSSSIEVTWNGAKNEISGGSIVFIPHGDSNISFTNPGRFILLFTTRNSDLCEKAINEKSYLHAHPNIPEFKAWPDPSQGFKVRHYSLDVPDEPGRFGRIWRCTNFMVNILPAQHGPRDVTKLSPHFHDSFEQGSLAIDGAFTHHVRWPWTSNLNNWRADDEEYCGSPSLAVIPPPAIHTSRGMAPDLNQLIDIFSPPRFDFSAKEGWVLNGDEYPVPDA